VGHEIIQPETKRLGTLFDPADLAFFQGFGIIASYPHDPPSYMYVVPPGPLALTHPTPVGLAIPPAAAMIVSMTSTRSGEKLMRQHSNSRFAIGLVTVALALSPAAVAQGRANREPTPNDTLKSPEVLPDHRVVFRIYAPKATQVSVSGDWIAQGRGNRRRARKRRPGRLVNNCRAADSRLLQLRANRWTACAPSIRKTR